jgi:AcrR family transcriptional regulator
MGREEHRAGRRSDDIPEPPWRGAPRRPAAPRPALSRDAIVQATLRLLDREGLDAISMRRVAEELGTAAASLYWHVGGKQELLRLAFDRVVAEIELPEPDPSRWREQIKHMARECRRVLTSHRDIARVALEVGIPAEPNALAGAEWMLEVLRGAGISDRVRAHAAYLVFLFVNAFALDESVEIPSPGGETVSAEEALAQFREYFASLPADRFPNTVALADHMMDPDMDARFELGLEMLVTGLAALSA